MNNIYWHEDNYDVESRNKAKLWMVFSFIFYVIYCAMMLADALIFDGNLRISLITLIVAAPLPIIPMIVYLKGIKLANKPMYIAVAASIAFLGFGTYLKVLDYHFFVLFITIGIVMVMKNFKLLLRTTLIISAINAGFIIGIVPRLEWIDNFRFTMQFIFFLFGSAFILFLTHNVDSKESKSDRALAAFTALLSSTPNLMAITDESRKVVYLSNSFLKFIGYPRKEYTVGQPLIDLIFDWKLKMVFADMLDAEDFYETEIDFEIDGEEHHFKLTTDRLTEGFAGIFVDISDITPIVHSRLIAEEASRSKSNFLATMSHEIRTPLNAIIGITQIQLHKENLPSEYAAALGKVNSAGNHLLGIINDILDLSKIESGNLELHVSQYDIPSIINDAVQLNIVRVGAKPIDFILDIDGTMPSKMYGDELRLKQILNNLLSNAVKYTDKGEVKLSVSSLHDETMKDDDIYLVFSVSDTGQGILPEDMDRLFSEQYLRLNAESNRTTEGTGLGLTIIKRLVEMMDGKISVSSVYGEGSIFTVAVKQKRVESPPIGAETAKSLREFSYVDERFRERRKTIRSFMPYGSVLVVDDSESNLFVAEGLLSPYKIKIKTVDSGFKAIEEVEAGKTFDIIFMDHMMPRMDGIETTKRLREMGYTNPIVALTANALTGNEAMFAENGFDGYIPKPIDTRRLDVALNTFIRDRHPEEAQFHRAEDMQRKEKTRSEDNAQSTQGAPRAADAAQSETDAAQIDFAIPPKLMLIFCREAEKDIGVLRQALNDKDIKLFTITVHALKSALANVGQQELSDRAKRLEQAGKEEDNDFIEANIDGFISSLEEFAGALKAELEKTEAGGEAAAGKSGDAAFLREQLVILVNACECYDDEMAYGALEKLMDMKWQRDITIKLENIHSAVFLDSDFDEAATVAKQMLTGG